MFELLVPFALLILILLFLSILVWRIKARKYISSGTVASAYDAWTQDKLLERLWGEHIHLGFYPPDKKKNDFRKAKVQFVHELVRWSGLDKLPEGSRILDVGCGIGGSSRILAKYYGFNVTGITISPAQVKRARELTPNELSCNFQVMDALNLKFDDGSFDGIWSVEAGAHMNSMKFKLPDLKSRISSCNIIEIKLPDDNLVEAILSKRLSDRQITIDKKYMKYAIKRIERSYENLSKFIHMLDKLSLKSGKSINFKVIREVLKKYKS